MSEKTKTPSESPEARRNRSSGPKTSAGKRRSSRNAIKHGLFSQNIILADENPKQFGELLKALRERYQPRSIDEELAVEKLAHDWWRYARFVRAERSELELARRFIDWDAARRQVAEAEKICSARLEVETGGGLMRHTTNPEILTRCLDLLDELKDGIRARGFNEEQDSPILENLYGTLDGNHVFTCLHDIYAGAAATAKSSEQERQSHGYSTPAESKRRVLAAIGAEIAELERFRDAQAAVEAERSELEKGCRVVPEGPALEKLLRYKAAIERAIERDLAQLAKLQELPGTQNAENGISDATRKERDGS